MRSDREKDYPPDHETKTHGALATRVFVRILSAFLLVARNNTFTVTSRTPLRRMCTQLLCIRGCTHLYGACAYVPPAASLMINSPAAFSLSLSCFLTRIRQTDIYGYLYDRISRMILRGLLNDAFATGFSCQGYTLYIWRRSRRRRPPRRLPLRSSSEDRANQPFPVRFYYTIIVEERFSPQQQPMLRRPFRRLETINPTGSNERACYSCLRLPRLINTPAVGKLTCAIRLCKGSSPSNFFPRPRDPFCATTGQLREEADCRTAVSRFFARKDLAASLLCACVRAYTITTAGLRHSTRKRFPGKFTLRGRVGCAKKSNSSVTRAPRAFVTRFPCERVIMVSLLAQDENLSRREITRSSALSILRLLTQFARGVISSRRTATSSRDGIRATATKIEVSISGHSQQ